MGRRRVRAWTKVAYVAIAMPGVSVSVRGVRAVPKCFPFCVDARLDVVEAREARYDPEWVSNRDVILIEALAEEVTETVRDVADWTGLIEETLGIEGTEGEVDPRAFWTRLERAMHRIELNLN
jgi:hypothetical protein